MGSIILPEGGWQEGAQHFSARLKRNGGQPRRNSGFPALGGS